MTKITLIGAGSYSWGSVFLRDIIITPELADSEICLHDIDAERMELNFRLAQIFVATTQADFRITQTLSLDEALHGADFIILTITTGGLEAMRHDLEIPARYGIQQSVGDTTGPGGLSRALRNIPVLAAMAKKVNEHCPKAWFLNYTNPRRGRHPDLPVRHPGNVGLRDHRAPSAVRAVGRHLRPPVSSA